MSYQGDINLEQTLRFTFTSRRFSTGAPYTLAGTPSLAVYEDGSLTQITAGLTLTVDFDGVTGLNHVAVAATAANGFEAGKDYSVVIAAGTVDSVSVVGEVLATFSIENRNREADMVAISGAAVNTAAAQLGVNIVQAAGTAWNSGAIQAATIAAGALAAAKFGTAFITSSSFASSAISNTAIANGAITSGKFGAAAITSSVLATDAVGASQLSAAAVAKIEAGLLNEGDGQALIAAIVAAIDAADIDASLIAGLTRDAILDRVLSGNHDTAGTVGKVIQDILADTGDLQTNQGNWLTATGFATEAKQDVIDGIVDAIKIVTDNLPESGALTTLLANVAAILDDTGNAGVAIGSATREAIAASLLDLADGVETNLTVRQQLRLAASALFSLCSGMGTASGAFRDFNNTKDRIQVTIDADGNRTAFAARDAT